MSETLRMWIELSFNTVYLVIIWGLVLAMYRHRQNVNPADQRTANMVLGAFTLLSFGDSGHVGFRVLAYIMGNLGASFSFQGMEFGLLGTGTLATAVTVTLFYVMVLVIWRFRFNKNYGPFEYLILGAALVRLIMLAMPANQWNSLVPPQPWATIRNIPLLIQGLGTAYLFMRDGRENNDHNFWWMGIMILVSYACYLPVILFVQQAPIIGMLMIPKTVAYLVMGFLAYNELYSTNTPKATLAGEAAY